MGDRSSARHAWRVVNARNQPPLVGDEWLLMGMSGFQRMGRPARWDADVSGRRGRGFRDRLVAFRGEFDPALEHAKDPVGVPDLLERISGDDEKVGERSGLDRPDKPWVPQGPAGAPGRRLQGLFVAESGSDESLELLMQADAGCETACREVGAGNHRAAGGDEAPQEFLSRFDA